MAEASRSTASFAPLTAHIARGVLVGMVLAVADGLTSPHLGGRTQPPGLALRIALLGLLPGVALLAAAVAWPLRGRLAAIPLAALGWLAGHELARGPQASRMPLAAQWSWLLALAGAAAALLWRRRFARGTPAWARAGLLAAAAAIYLAAAFTLRGLYRDLRELAACACGLLLFAALGRALDARPRAARALVGLGVLALLAGAGTAARSSRGVEWARRSGTALSAWSTRIHRALAAAVDEPDAMDLAPERFFEEPVAAESLVRLRERGGPPRGVLLVIIDALRADVAGASFAGRPATPFLDGRRAASLVLGRAYAPSAASHMSMFSALSGLYPSQIVSHPGGVDEVPLVTERLGPAEVATAASFPYLVHNMKSVTFTRVDFGFDRATIRPDGERDPPAAELLAQVCPPAGARRWFSYLHLIAPHAPYDGAPASLVDGDDAFSRYVGEVRAADEKLRELLALFEREGLLEDTWVIVGADHGEEFMEHGAVRHAAQLYEESVHVPLMIWGPGVAPGAFDGPVSLADLAPTLDHVFELQAAGRPPYAGRSWVPLAAGVRDGGRRSHVLVEIPPFESEFLTVMGGIVGPRWKLLVDERERRFELFDLASDPGERRNLAHDRHERVQREWSRLKALRGLSTGASDAYRDLDPTLKNLDLAEYPEQALAGAVQLPVNYLVMPKFMVMRALSAYARDGDAEVVLVLDRVFRSHADADFRAALSLMRWSARMEEPGDRAAALALLDRTTDPFVLAAGFAAFRRRRDAGLVELDAAAAGPHRLVADLARAAYRAELGEPSPDGGALLDAGWSNPHAWVRRLAAELAESARPVGWGVRLREALEPATTPRLAAALVTAAARWPAAETTVWLRRVARTRDDLAARAALAALADRTDGGATRRLLATPRVPDGPTTELELAAAPGSVIGLYLEAAPRLAARPLVLVSAAGWQQEVEVPRGRGRLPLRLELPAGVTADRLTLRLRRGRPDELVTRGLVTLGRD